MLRLRFSHQSVKSHKKLSKKVTRLVRFSGVVCFDCCQGLNQSGRSWYRNRITFFIHCFNEKKDIFYNKKKLFHLKSLKCVLVVGQFTIMSACFLLRLRIKYVLERRPMLSLGLLKVIYRRDCLTFQQFSNPPPLVGFLFRYTRIISSHFKCVTDLKSFRTELILDRIKVGISYFKMQAYTFGLGFFNIYVIVPMLYTQFLQKYRFNYLCMEFNFELLFKNLVLDDFRTLFDNFFSFRSMIAFIW